LSPGKRCSASFLARGDTELVPLYDELGKTGLRADYTRKNAQSIDGKPTGILT
jgi:hypothetical protein